MANQEPPQGSVSDRTLQLNLGSLGIGRGIAFGQVLCVTIFMDGTALFVSARVARKRDRLIADMASAREFLRGFHSAPSLRFPKGGLLSEEIITRDRATFKQMFDVERKRFLFLVLIRAVRPVR